MKKNKVFISAEFSACLLRSPFDLVPVLSETGHFVCQFQTSWDVLWCKSMSDAVHAWPSATYLK